MDYWKGKIAVVTGASSGIGAQLLLDLAKSGLIVIGLARRVDRINDIASKNKSISGKIYGHECDVSKIDSIVKAFKWIEEKFKVVHIIINNAGRSSKGETLDLNVPHEQMKATIDINLTGLVVCTREAFRLMEKHEDLGYIININSIFGHISYTPRYAGINVYHASKYGVTSHTETVRLDLATKGNTRIRVTVRYFLKNFTYESSVKYFTKQSLSPGFTRTEIMEAQGVPKETSDQIYDSSPHILPSDISHAIKFLLELPKHVNISELSIKPTGETL